MASSVVPNVDSAPVLIDLGCGQDKIEREGYQVIGVDIWTKSNADVIASAFDLPFEKESIDLIYARHFFEHFAYDDLVRVLVECYRILKPSGRLEITCPHYSGLSAYQDPTHRMFFSRRTFFKFSPFGFRVVETRFDWMRDPYCGRFPWLVRFINRRFNRNPNLERFAYLVGGLYEIEGILQKDPASLDPSHTDGARLLST